MNVINDAQRSAAKVAALAYPISMAFVASANFGLRGDLVANGDVAETVRRIAAAEPLYRLSVVFDLVYATDASDAGDSVLHRLAADIM